MKRPNDDNQNVLRIYLIGMWVIIMLMLYNNTQMSIATNDQNERLKEIERLLYEDIEDEKELVKTEEK